MKAPVDCMGPRCRALLSSLERRLRGAALLRSTILGGAALLLFRELALTAPILFPSLPAAWLAFPLAALAVATAGALAPLVRRPSRCYLAELCERSCPAFAGQLMLLSEAEPGADPGVLELASEQAETAAAAASARAAARLEKSRPFPWLLSAVLLAAGAALSLASGRNPSGSASDGPGLAADGLPVRQADTSPVTVRPGPALRLTGIDYTYPDYTGLGRIVTDGADGIDCLQGARAELRLQASGQVDGVTLRVEPMGESVVAEPGPDGRWRASFVVRKVGACTVTMRSAGTEHQALRLSVTARRDLSPVVAVLARELPDGRLVLDYRAADDYRLGAATVTFTSFGRDSVFSVPDVAGQRETHGTVLVPREVLAMAGATGFRYRMEAVDTCHPEPNRAVSDDLEYRPPQQLAVAGPLLERRPPPVAPYGESASPPAGSAAPGQDVRPLETLRKEREDEEPPGPQDREEGRAEPPPGDGEFLAPPGEEAPGQKQNPGQRKPPDTPGPEDRNGDESGRSDGPRDTGGPGRGNGDGGEGGATPAPTETVNTPGRGGAPSGTGQAATPSGNPGSQAGGEKPPTGSETGSRGPLPERVMPGQVNMEIRPDDIPATRYTRPTPARTDWGGEATRGDSSSVAPTIAPVLPGTVNPPGPAIRPGTVETGLAGPLPVAPQYRRYVNEYLRALASGGK